MAYVDAPLMKQILDILQGEREPDIHHNGQPDDFGRRLEIANRTAFDHFASLDASHPRSKPVLSDRAHLSSMVVSLYRSRDRMNAARVVL